jgi:hypothetical protein
MTIASIFQSFSWRTIMLRLNKLQFFVSLLTLLVCASGPASAAVRIEGQLQAGGGGLAITRAQIPSTNTGGAQALILVGYSMPNDIGWGAPYTCSGQTSSSLLAIQDSVGNWCALSMGPGVPLNIGWFGADASGATDSAPAIQKAIDSLYNTSQQSIFCPTGNYKITEPIFLEAPGGLRGPDGTHGINYNAGTTYSVGQAVNFAGVAYTSLQNSNTGNTPNTSPTFWGPFNWNAGTTYPLNANVSYHGVPWKSLVAGNIGNTPPAVDAAAWNSATTYSIGQTVNWGGQVYTSIQNSNTNNNPHTSPTFWKIFWQLTWMQNGNASNFGYGFYGPPTIYGTFGCNILATYQNGVWLQIGAGNGTIVKHINLNYGGKGASLYDAQMPSNGIGICIPGDSGGSNRVVIEELAINSVFYAIQTSCNVDGLGAENTIRKVAASNCVVYFTVLGSQNFANTIEEASSGCVDGVIAQTGPGYAVRGGNWSAPGEQTVSNTWTVSGTSALTLLPSTCGNPNCRYQFTTTIVSSSGGTGGAGPSTGPDSFMLNCPVGSESCVYNSWTMLLPHYGLIPLNLVSLNRSTNLATFQTYDPWQLYYYHQHDATAISDIATEVAAVTQLYAAERASTFTGLGVDVSDIHVENGTACNTFLTANGLAGDVGIMIRRIYFNANPSQDQSGPKSGNNPGSLSFPQFACQQSWPFINYPGSFVGTSFERVRWASDQGGSSVIIDNANVAGNDCSFDGNGNLPLWSPIIRTSFRNSDSFYTTQNGACHYSINPWVPPAMGGPDGFASNLMPFTGFYPSPYATARLPVSTYATLQSVAGLNPGVDYPPISGQTIYSILDHNCGACSPSTPARWVQSAHMGYSYGQNLTTSNVSGLSWVYKGGSCFVLANANLFNVIFPGLSITLDNGSGPQHYIITGLEPWMSLDGGTHRGYFTIVQPSGDGCGVGTSGTTYTGTVIGQDPFVWNTARFLK